MADPQPTHTQPEEWRPVVGFEGLYEISARGEVRSLDRNVKYSDGRVRFHPGRFLRPQTNNSGYSRVRLWKSNSQYRRYLHRLLAEAYIGPIPKGMEVCHRDGNQNNNRIENLRIDTVSGNKMDAVKHGTHVQSRKTHCSRGHKFAGNNLIRHPSSPRRRVCRSCLNARSLIKRMMKGSGIDANENFQEISDSYYEEYCGRG